MYFDTRDDDSSVIEIWSNELTVRIMNGETIPDLVQQITEVTGRMDILPKWTQTGAIIGMRNSYSLSYGVIVVVSTGLEGGTHEVEELSEKLLDLKYGLPVAGFWIQDWIGTSSVH